MEIERRVYAGEIVFRAEGTDKPRLRGHAAVFDSLSVDLGGFKERIAPGAFAKSIEKSDVRALWNHDANFVLGRNKSGTLKLVEDQKGLAIEIDPPDTQTIRDLVLAPIERGDVSQMSFGFRTVSDKWETENKAQVRTLLEVELFDVSPVTFPAYPKTDVAVRSLEAWLRQHPHPDHALELLRRRLTLV